MAVAEDKSLQPSGIEKKGGYSGGKPAATVPPPSRVPSATIKPAHEPKPQPASN